MARFLCFATVSKRDEVLRIERLAVDQPASRMLRVCRGYPGPIHRQISGTFLFDSPNRRCADVRQSTATLSARLAVARVNLAGFSDRIVIVRILVIVHMLLGLDRASLGHGLEDRSRPELEQDPQQEHR